MSKKFKKITSAEASPEFTVRGNNDGNYVKVWKIDDRYMGLEVGDCCVVTIKVKISAEALSSFLTQIYLKENKDFLDVVESNMGWMPARGTAEINEKFFGESCNLNWKNEKI